MSLLSKEYVYLLEEIEIDSDKPTGLVKIGRTSNDVENRISQLKTGNPRKLRRFAAIETEIGQSIIEEAKQHNKYVALRAPDGGGIEWFKDDTDIIKPLFKMDADKSIKEYEFYCDQLEDFMSGKYKNTFSFVRDNIYRHIKTKHICVLAPPKSGKRIMVQSMALLMPYAHHYFITALDRKADRHQIKEFDPYAIFAICLTNSNKDNIESISSMKENIKKAVSDHKEIVIHFDECDYGSHENGMVGSFIRDLKAELTNENVHFIVYSATPEEAIWSDADYQLAHYKPTDDYNGPDWFLANDLVVDPVPFINSDSNNKPYLNQQAKDLLNDWKDSDKKYIVLRLNYSLKDKFLSRRLDKSGNRLESRSAFEFAKENLQDLIDTYLKDSNVEVEFYDQEDNFDWVFLNKDSKMPGTWFRIHDNKKRLIVINGTCTRSTEVGFHPDIFAWHDYRKGGKKASTNYGTYAQAIGRVFHYMPDYKKKERTNIFNLKDTKIRLYVEKDLISVMKSIYSSFSKTEMENIWKQYADKNKLTIRKPGARIVSGKNNSAMQAKIHFFSSEKEAVDKRKSILEEDALKFKILNKAKATGIAKLTERKAESGPDFIRRIKEEKLPSRQDILIHIDGPPGNLKFKNNYDEFIVQNPNILGQYVVFEPIMSSLPSNSMLRGAKTLHNEIV